jgi:beta-fructofuranosidase
VLSSREDWIWDSWLADDGERHHLFSLRAPRALGDPDLRHVAARIGHASSVDLQSWDVHEDALTPGSDDLALWTGSVVRGGDGRWRLYYTALGGDIAHQRIKLAESDDLRSWRRVASDLVEPDPCHYAMTGTWRDPFVFRHDGGWHMLITARDPAAQRLFDGVLAHARSDDMVTWRLAPPLTEPAMFGQLEVAQVRRIGERWVLLFTCHPDEQGERREYCAWYVVGDSPLGPWDVAAARPFEDEPRLFAAQLVQRRDGSWALIGFLEGDFAVIDPIGVELAGGTLRRSAPAR